MTKVKYVNLVFLSTVIIALLSQFLNAFLMDHIQNQGILILINQVLIIVPCVIYLIVKKINPLSYLRVNKMSISSLVLLVVFGYLIIPVSSFINMLSMTIFSNEVAGTIQLLTEQNTLIVSLLIMAVVPAIFEEVVYRGFFFREYRDQNVLKGMVLSALLFGFMHMNGNQFSYAFILGMIFVLVIEATGSIISTILIHFIINSTSVIISYLYPTMIRLLSSLEQYQGMSENDIKISLSGEVLENLTVGFVFKNYGLTALISAILAFLVFRTLAKNNNRWEHLKGLFKKSQKNEVTLEKQKLITIPLMIGMLICIGIMVYVELV